MKKSMIAFLLIGAMSANSVTVFAQEATEEYVASEDTLGFLTVLQIPEKKDAIELTLEEATQKALSRSTALKTSNMDLNISAEKR